MLIPLLNTTSYYLFFKNKSAYIKTLRKNRGKHMNRINKKNSLIDKNTNDIINTV